MTENEQVGEMARIIGHCESTLHPDIKCHSREHGCYCAENPCYNERIAIRLYSESYRKVERGEWKKTCVPDVFQCTNCKRPTKMDMFCDSEILRPFCPNCGADMRGDNNAEIH